MRNKIKAAYLQFGPIFGDPKGNLDSIEKAVSHLKADLLVLPELCLTGYAFSSRKEALSLSEPLTGPSIQRLKGIARGTGIGIVAGFAEKARGRAYNSAVFIGPRDVIGVYRKSHLFFEETMFFSKGDTRFPVFKYKNARIGMMICFDWFFPESARSLAIKGADIIAHPSNLVLPWCQKAMITRSIENRVFTITANRTGSEKRSGRSYSFTGASQITSPFGEILASSGRRAAEIKTADLDINSARDKRLNRYNSILLDIRPDSFYSVQNP